MSYDSEAKAVYLAVDQDVPGGSAVENVVVERPDRGDIIVDFGPDARAYWAWKSLALENFSASPYRLQPPRREPARGLRQMSAFPVRSGDVPARPTSG